MELLLITLIDSTSYCRCIFSFPCKSINFSIYVLGNETYEESRGRIVLTEDERNIKNAVLLIENVVLEDRQIYNCTGTNSAIKYGNANYSEAQEYIYVRVKGNNFRSK